MKKISLFTFLSIILHAALVSSLNVSTTKSNNTPNITKTIYFTINSPQQTSIKQRTRHIRKKTNIANSKPTKQQNLHRAVNSKITTNVKSGSSVLDLPLSYPLKAIKDRMTGTVIVKVGFTHSGEVSSKEIIKSSGHQLLDICVLNALKHGKLKATKSNLSMTMNLSFEFKL
jgi:TonB family protein